MSDTTLDDDDAYRRRQLAVDGLLWDARMAATFHIFEANTAAIRGRPEPEIRFRISDPEPSPRRVSRKQKGSY